MKSFGPASELERKSGRRTCSIACRARNRIEQGKQQKSGQKTADMGLPGDADALRANRNRSEAKYDIDAKPDREKGKHAAIPQGLQQWLRGHLGGSDRVAAVKGEKTAAHEGKANRGRHGAGDRGGGTDHRGQ